MRKKEKLCRLRAVRLSGLLRLSPGLPPPVRRYPQGVYAPEQNERNIFWKKEEAAAERKQDAEALPDIDRLMREMTKRLWEEREGCGRRLGG